MADVAGHGDERMNLQKVYTTLLTADLARAEGWYTQLLGRRPDHRPMATPVQWELFDQGGLMLSTSDEIAGMGVMFLYVDDVAAEAQARQAIQQPLSLSRLRASRGGLTSHSRRGG
jgi:hypothetical protein